MLTRKSYLDNFLYLAIALILGLQLHLQFVQKINWDEFYFLSLVYDYQRGDLSKPLQTAHVHFFGWLKYISPNDVTQIIVARVVMWCIQLGTLYFIYKTAKTFVSQSAAIFTVLSFLGFGFVFVHGTSFRADPIAACLLSGATYIFVASKLRFRSLAILSVILALAALVTIKVIFFAPLFVALALWRLSNHENAKGLFIKFLLCALASAVLFSLGYFLQLNLMPKAAMSSSGDMLSSAGKTTLLSGELFPRSTFIKQNFSTGLVPSIMLFLGLLYILADFTKASVNHKKLWVLLAMGLPVISLVFYRNAYPYYFAFILPTIVLWAGVAAERFKKNPIILAILTLLIIVNIGVRYGYRLNESHQVQSSTLEELHRIFPQPVHYIDRSSMMPSYPKSGFFMSSWGLQSYLSKGEPVILQAMKANTIPVVIENSHEINRALIKGVKDSELLPQDQMALRENYILHWGHIWIAGKVLDVSPKVIDFNNLVPGEYRLESDGPVIINGTHYVSGDIITLQRGLLNVQSLLPQKLTLRWSKVISAPDALASTRPIFTEF